MNFIDELHVKTRMGEFTRGAKSCPPQVGDGPGTYQTAVGQSDEVLMIRRGPSENYKGFYTRKDRVCVTVSVQ